MFIRLTPIQHDAKALWSDIKAIAEDSSCSLEERRMRAMERAEKFILHAQQDGDEPRALMGCMVEATMRYKNFNWPDSFREFPIATEYLNLIQSRERKNGKLPFSSDAVGVAAVVRDIFEQRYKTSSGTAKFLTNMAASFLAGARNQETLVQVLQAHHLNPFADVSLALVGPTAVACETLSIRNLFQSCEIFDTHRTLTAQSAAAHENRFDYVVDGNVVNHNFDSSNSPVKFLEDVTMITKPGGKIIHVCTSSPAPPFLKWEKSIIRDNSPRLFTSLYAIDHRKTNNTERIRTDADYEYAQMIKPWSQVLVYQKKGNELVLQPSLEAETQKELGI